MCLAIPARVVDLPEPDVALIDVDGVRPGDYVIVHVGYALTRLDPEEAERTLATFVEAGLLPAEAG